jgi:SnoaL-like domain
LEVIMKKILLSALAAGIMFAGTCMAANGLSAQDYFEIQQLYARYNIAIDNGDAEGWAATFTADGVFNTSVGHDALVNFVKTWREKLGGATRKHWNNNLLITGNSKEASGNVYLMLVDISTKPPSILATASYTDSLVKTKDGWRFTKRTTKGDSPPAAPSAPAAGAPPPK